MTILPGDNSGMINVPITNDSRDEPDETFTVSITSVTPQEARITRTTGTVTIGNDDQNVQKPTFSVADVVQDEGNSANYADFTVTLSQAAADDVSFTASMADDSAVDAGSGVGSNDYNQPVSLLTIIQGRTTGTIRVPVNGDSVFEDDESATLTVGLAAGELDATGDPATATLSLLNDDNRPTVTLSNASGTEGDDITLAGTVTGSTQDDATVGVEFEGDSSGTNTPASDSDYDASNVDPTVPAGSTTGARISLGSITLNPDTIDENTETIKVTSAGKPPVSYRIIDSPDNVPPTVTVMDETIGEGDGSVNLTVGLNFPEGTTETGYNVTVPWHTVDGSAKAPSDYTNTSDTVTIPAGEDSATIEVPITDDNGFEPDQSFTVRLGTPAPAAAKIEDGTGIVTINDDDQPVAPTLIAPASRGGTGPVALTGVASEGARVMLFAASLATPTTYTNVATTTADGNGAYSFSRTIDRGYNFYTRANELNSPIRTVRIGQLPTLTGGSTTKGTVTLTTVGNPKAAGQTVQFQRALATGGWATIATGTLTSSGTLTMTIKNQTSGQYFTYRAVYSSSAPLGIVGAVSDPKRIGIR
jgi:hypothetical protein